MLHSTRHGRAVPIDALIVEEGIGGRGADTVLAALCADRPPITLVLSECATVASFRRSASAGFNLHIVRPCSPETIAGAVTELLRLRDDGRFQPGTFDVIRFGAVFPGGRQFGTV